MLVKPNTALTGVPSGRVIGGSAWNARKMNPEPSTSTRFMEVSVSAVAASFFQDVDAGAVGAHHLMVLDVQEHARVAKRTAVACDGAVIDLKGLRGKIGAVRHFCPRSGGLRP